MTGTKRFIYIVSQYHIQAYVLLPLTLTLSVDM